MTALVMEPDETVQRQLLALMTSRNYRVVPVRSADEGIDLAQRMRFEVAFCSVRLPGLNWVELYDRVHSQVGAFVLVADGYDPELALSFRGEGRFVLSKPIEEAQLDRILEWVENMVRRSLLQVSV
jgi:CheY-like chemotaxis protein